MSQPQANDYAPYFSNYVSRVQAGSLKEAISTYSQLLQDFYTALPEDKADYSYAPGKWTLKDLLQHVIDTERIMSYRVLRISREDQTPLASFDENNYAVSAKAGSRSFADIKAEFVALRTSTNLLLQSLSEEQLSHAGTASDHRATANAVGFIIFGHMLHHKQIIEERYL